MRWFEQTIYPVIGWIIDFFRDGARLLRGRYSEWRDYQRQRRAFRILIARARREPAFREWLKERADALDDQRES